MCQMPSALQASPGKQPAHGYEFLGPWFGPTVLPVALPAVCYLLYLSCNKQGCFQLAKIGAGIPGVPPGVQLFTWEAAAVFLGWLVVQALLHVALPGVVLPGVDLPDGSRLTYKLTGLRNLAVTLTALAVAVGTQHISLGWLYDNYLPLMTASILFSFGLATCLYMSSFRGSKLLAKGGSTGHVLYDFFMGRELNPRICQIDVKEFCELYPGMIGWVVLNLGMVQKQYEHLGRVTPALLLVAASQFIYVLDSLWFEPAILTTMDITTDGFGFMLAFGDLAWLPFTYSLQARYLVDHPQELSAAAIGGILLLKALGYLIFRGSNSQKDQFRRDPSHPAVARLQTLKTERGRRLIVSGWWGIARHINYFGDWLMAWSWCLPCGFHSIVPYFYVIYFGILLVHRDRRDSHSCKLKYGRDWDKYCSLVKYRIVPLIY